MNNTMFYSDDLGRYFYVFGDGSVATFKQDETGKCRFFLPADPSRVTETDTVLGMLHTLKKLKRDEADWRLGPATWHTVEAWLDALMIWDASIRVVAICW